VQRTPLHGQFAELVPLEIAHVDELVAAANEDRSNYEFTTVPQTVEAMQQYVSVALADEAAGWSSPFTVRRVADRQVVGSTRFLDIDYWVNSLARPELPVPTGGLRFPRVAEIGATWYSASAQRTPINTECKLLLMRHGFENWGLERISFKTDSRNARSRAAIERLGAKFEGVRRAHVLGVDGVIRDSAYYSVLAAEWSQICTGLEKRLAAH
jgi:RimJ/RimL family protein N-acetyltransferase